MTVIYVHGFASSPLSSKATFFAERFRACGVRFLCPDFNQPDFSTLTVSRMLQQLEHYIAALPEDEIVLIGSSLGGFVAVEAAARQANRGPHPISHVILLAPAVELEWERWSEVGPGGIDRWRRHGDIEVFHYAEDAPRRLKFDFYVDSEQYRPAARRLMLPMLIFQGRCDDSVSPAIVERFASVQRNAALYLVEDGHQLKESLELIWEETAKFLGLMKPT